MVVGVLAERGFNARTIAVGSLGGVAALSRGECDLAPVHLVDPATGVYNKHLLAPGLALVPGWRRMQGFVYRSGDTRFEGRTADSALKAALADPAVLMVNRNAGSGTRVLIDSLLGRVRPPGYANQPRSHNAVSPFCPSRPKSTIFCSARRVARGLPCRLSWTYCRIKQRETAYGPSAWNRLANDAT